MSAIIVTDTHCGIYNASPLWHNIVIKLFKHIADTCIRENISEIIHLGDWFHDRKSLNIQTIQTCLDIMDIIKDFHISIVIGNHDLFYKNSIKPTSLSFIQMFDNVEIIDMNKTIRLDGYKVSLVPWIADEIPNTDILFGHLEITNSNILQRFKYSENDFKHCGKVYSGHFHTPMKFANIEYIGAPYHMTFNDSGSRGYYIFDNGDLRFVEFENFPKFKKIIASLDNIDSDEIKDNIVKLIYTEDFGTEGNQKIIDLVQSFKPLQLYTDFSQMSIKSDNGFEIIDNIEIVDNKQLLFNYIDLKKHPSHINTNTLKRIVSSLLTE